MNYAKRITALEAGTQHDRNRWACVKVRNGETNDQALSRIFPDGRPRETNIIYVRGGLPDEPPPSERRPDPGNVEDYPLWPDAVSRNDVQ
jgi:hypothetical protein